MTTAAFVLALGIVSGAPAPAAWQAPPAAVNPSSKDVVVEIRIHGNQVTPDAELIRLSGVAVGDRFDPNTLAAVRQRLNDTGLFRDVEVMKRFASLTDASRIALVIVVNEGPVRVELPDTTGSTPDTSALPHVVRRSAWSNVLIMPVLYGEDGHGLTFGAELGYPGVFGDRSRVSFPLTWGGRKEAGVSADRTFRAGPLSRIDASASIAKTTNPGFDIDDTRRRIGVRAERSLGGSLRAGSGIAWETIAFGSLRDEMTTVDADLVLDTRLDPVLPRNAVYVRVGWRREDLSSGLVAHRVDTDARGYLGLIGQTVLGVRLERQSASTFLPPYLRPLLGGWSSLRGFRAGAFSGDTVVSGSVGLTMPLSPVLSSARYGIDVFTDVGVAYDHGASFSGQPIHTGIGGALWFTAATFRVGLSVAHGRGSGTRVNFGARVGR